MQVYQIHDPISWTILAENEEDALQAVREYEMAGGCDVQAEHWDVDGMPEVKLVPIEQYCEYSLYDDDLGETIDLHQAIEKYPDRGVLACSEY